MDILNNLRKLPWTRSPTNCWERCRGANRLVNARNGEATIRSLDTTLKDVRALAREPPTGKIARPLAVDARNPARAVPWKASIRGRR